MSTEAELHFVCTLFILAAAFVPVYLSVMLKGNLRKLAALLSVFVLIHAGYHVAGVMGMDFLSEDIFEPLSIAALIMFGLFYLNLTRRAREVIQSG